MPLDHAYALDRNPQSLRKYLDHTSICLIALRLLAHGDYKTRRCHLFHNFFFRTGLNLDGYMNLFHFAGLGFEPRYSPPKGDVLPLDDPAIILNLPRYTIYMKKGLLVIIPLVIFTAFNSRPVVLPAQQVAAPSAQVVPLPKPAEQSEEISLSIVPERVIQGEPVLIKVTGTSTAKSIVFNKVSLPVFAMDGKPAALVGIDLRMTPGTYPVTLTLSDGKIVKQNLVVGERKLVTAPLGIPEKLGGNTPEAEKELVSTLVEEGKIINAIKTSDEKLWNGTFRFPLGGQITITDVYGYSRETGGSSIAHKGTDFRAPVGTPVFAINAGKVAYVGFLRNYGHVVAVDHGSRLLSLAMHLSEVSVVAGQRVEKGQVIGRSGDTGYVLGPHLHLTLRIGGISIDPMKFYALLET